MKSIRLIVWILFILLTGCGRTELETVHLNVPKEVRFGEIRTRGSDTGVANSADNSGFTFSLSASLDNEEPTTDYLWNVKVSNENGHWKSVRPIYWMNGLPITFFAIAPYVENQDIVQLSKAGEAPILTYTPPENAEEHIDLMTSSCTKSDGSVNLVFDHILTQIRFTVGKTFRPGTKVNEIRLKGIAVKGEYNQHSLSWTILPEYGQFAVSDVGFTMDDSKTAGDLISETYFFVPPQSITNKDACIEIFAEDDGLEIIGTMSLAGSRWEAGTIKTYFISYDGARFYASMLEDLKDSTRVDMDERNEITTD